MVPRPYSALSHLECARCGAVHDAAVVQGLCGCGSPLLARYDLAGAGALADRAEIGRRPAGFAPIRPGGKAPIRASGLARSAAGIAFAGPG